MSLIRLSDDVPQFKSGADAHSGLVEPLAGRFERIGVAPVQLWERQDGRLEVISGRHRFDLARRSGETTIPSQIHREVDGFDRLRAAILDAELNIRDSQGSIHDYAAYFRSSGIAEAEAVDRGLLARSKGRAGWTIAHSGGDALFAAHRAGRITDAAAEAIAQAAPGSDAIQSVGLRAVMDDRPLQVAVNTMRAVMAAGVKSSGDQYQVDLFGFDDTALAEAEAQARRATAEQRALRDRIAAVKGAAMRPAQAKEMGVNVRRPAAVMDQVRTMEAELTRWDSWHQHADLVERVVASDRPQVDEGSLGALDAVSLR